MRLKLVKSNILDKGSVPHVSFRFLAASMPFLSSHQQAWFFTSNTSKNVPTTSPIPLSNQPWGKHKKKENSDLWVSACACIGGENQASESIIKKIDVLPQDDNFRLICGFLRCCCCEIHMFLGMEPLIVARKIGYEFGQHSQIWYHFCVIFAANLIANVK